jgi:exodeoxyribonuclease VII large subunit
MLTRAERELCQGQLQLTALDGRLQSAPLRRLHTLSERLERLDRTRLTLGHHETLKRGFVILRGDGEVVTSRGEAERATQLEAQFHDGRLLLGPKSAKRGKGDDLPSQGSLF